MKKAILLVLFICLRMLSYSQDLGSFKFLIGSWSVQKTSGRIIESWVRTADGYSGKSFKIMANGDSMLMETMVLKAEGNQILFIPTTAGQNEMKPVIFKLVSAKGKSFVFENKLHDFPSRIVYQNKTPNELFAWIEGTVNGSQQKIEYPYVREKNY